MKKLFALSLFALPIVTFAQRTGSVTDANSLIRKINSLMDAAIPLLVTFAVLYLVYAIVRYIIAGDEETRKEGKKMVMWGIAGLAIIMVIWGIVRLLVNTVGIGNNNTPTSNELPSALPTRPIR